MCGGAGTRIYAESSASLVYQGSNQARRSSYPLGRGGVYGLCMDSERSGCSRGGGSLWSGCGCGCGVHLEGEAGIGLEPKFGDTVLVEPADYGGVGRAVDHVHGPGRTGVQIAVTAAK